jgi:hypothetical protein
MYDFVIKDMALVVSAALSRKSGDSEKVICAALREYWKTRMAVVWTVGDVATASDMIGVRLTAKEKCRVLQYAHCDHDATTGINWHVLCAAITRLYPKKRKRGAAQG